jgi:acetylornithine deacetylase/succinyl-diaminopimelate desuccinylase-like protein
MKKLPLLEKTQAKAPAPRREVCVGQAFSLPVAALLASTCALCAQPTWFDRAILDQPAVRAAFESVDRREPALIEEWIHLTETSSPSGKEQARAQWVRQELEKLHLTEIRTDDWMNVSAVRKGTGGGRSVVIAAHTDTVFPDGTPLKVKREGNTLSAPGIGDDTGNLIATLEMVRALDRAKVETPGDLIFLASVREEIGLLGMQHWMEKSGYRPDLVIAVDLSSEQVWYGALRIDQFKFIYTSPGAHTLESRGLPSPARAVARGIESMYHIPLPPIREGFGSFKLPTINVGMLQGGTVMNAIPREAWFTVDLRSLDSTTQDRLATAVVSAAKSAAETEGVGFRTERRMGIDYSKALPPETRRAHPLVQTAVDVANLFRKPGTGVVEPMDAGSTDANIGVSMGIPSVAVGAIFYKGPHTLEEHAEADSLALGVKRLIALAVCATQGAKAGK